MKTLWIDSSDFKQVAMALDVIRSLSVTGKSYKLVISERRKSRTAEQNMLYWVAYVQPFADWLRETGRPDFTDEMAHRVLAEMFLNVSEMVPTTGEVVTWTRSTTELSTTEFGEYLEKIGAFFATDTGIKRWGSNKKGNFGGSHERSGNRAACA